MITKHATVTNIGDYIKQFQQWRKEQDPLDVTVSRGEPKAFDYPCLSTLGRLTRNNEETESQQYISFIEKMLIDQWVKLSQNAEQTTYPNDEWNHLLRARHHGLVCRVTDWTTNPLVSLFMSVMDQKYIDSDGYVYVTNTFVARGETIESSPYSNSYMLKSEYYASAFINLGPLSHIFLYPPTDFHKRIVNQSSIFHISSNPENTALEIETIDTFRITIPKENKEEVFHDLQTLNISSTSLALGYS